MKLFVANCTKQVQDLNYRVLEMPGVRRQNIEVGRQVQLSGDFSTPDIEYITKQLAKYGGVRADEIDRTKPFVGICWSIDKPVARAIIEKALDHNDKVLEARGEQLRKESAIAIAGQLDESVRPMKSKLTELEVEMTEIGRKDSDIEMGTQRIKVTSDPNRLESYGVGQSGGKVSGRRGRAERAAAH